ncbi:hypothetical protein BDZ89DRAFT_1052576 [Hymenopellis radicata]|nr:hypothetical protein BDZ89DRAFT_1052576 [Hymenopellis radicata]
MLRTFSTHRDTSWSEITTLPWSQFTAMLHFSAFDRDELVHLPKMANLEELDAVVDEQYETINEVVYLPNLRRLTLKETERVSAGRLEEFFGKLDVPNLADLALTFILTASKGTLRFPTLLTGASGLDSLTKLRLSWGFTTENWHPENAENILRFLSLTPRVSELATPCVMPVGLVSGLSATSGILPCLRVLDMGECLFDGDSRVALYDMLESRCAFTVGVGTPPSSGTSGVGISRTSHWRDTETDVPVHGVKCLEMSKMDEDDESTEK